MKTVALWHIRPDAPYKSRQWGLWVVADDQVSSIVAQIRATPDWEESRVLERPVSDAPDGYVPFGDSYEVVFVNDFVPGLLHCGDSHGSYPGLFEQ